MPHLLAEERGTSNAVRGWCQALVDLEQDVVCLVDESMVNLPPPDEFDCIPLRHRSRGIARYPLDVDAHLKGADVLVVHGGWQLGNIVAARRATAVDVPFVVTTQGVYNPIVFTRKPVVKKIWTVLLERRHLRKSLAVHVFFEDEREGLEMLGVESETVTAPNGVSPPPNLAWDGGSGGYLLWLGRFDPENKGLDLLLHAIRLFEPSARPRIRLHGPDWRDQKQVVHDMALELDLLDWVEVGDPIYGEAKWSAIASAAACVYPSRWDACPVAVIESVSLGVPTLVANYPLGRFLVSRGAAVAVELTPQDVARGIEELLEGGARFGPTGAEVARKELAWPSVARSWLNQVETLLDKRELRSTQPSRD